MLDPGPVRPGYKGSVVLPSSLLCKINNVSFTRSNNLGDISGFGDGGENALLALIRSLAGTASGFVTTDDISTILADDGTILSVPTVMKIFLNDGAETVPETIVGISFNALLSEIRVVGNYAGLWAITFNWAKSDGIITKQNSL